MIFNQLKRLLKGSSIYGIGSIVSRSISFLLLPVFTAYLTPEDYGIIAILGIISLLATPIFQLGFGVSPGLIYFEEDDNKRKNSIIWTAFIILLISASTLTTLVFVFSNEISYFAFQSHAYQYLIKLHILSTAFDIMILPLQQRLQFEEKAKLFVLLTLTSSIVTILLNIFFVVVLLRGVQGWILGSLIGRLLTFSLFFMTTIYYTKFTFNLSFANTLLKYGYPLIPGFALMFIIRNSGKYMLQYYHGLDEVGVYNIGFSIGMLMKVPLDAFSTAWYPFFQSFVNKKGDSKKIFKTIFTYYILGFGGLCLLLFTFAKPVILLMTTPAFHEAYKVVGMIALAQIFVGVSYIFSPGMYYAKKVHYGILINLVGAVAVIILNYLLIPIFGISGAAFSMVFGFAVMTALQYLLILVKKFWIPDFDWIRIVQITAIYTVFIIFVTILSINLSDQIYVLFSSILMIILIIGLWVHLSDKEKSFARQNIIKLYKRTKKNT